MNRRYLALGLVLVAGLLAASPADEAQSWLRRGDQAFLRGKYELAVSCYEKAEPCTTEPTRVAFNLAAARYFRDRPLEEGAEPNLSEVAELYRCCLDPDDPRYVQALFGLGTCLMQSAGAGSEELNAAVDCFDRCLARTQDAELRDAARHNREAARLQLAQILPPSQRDVEPPNREQSSDDKKDPRQSRTEPGDPTQQPGDRKGEKGNAVPAALKPGEVPRPSDERPLPGRNPRLPPPSESDDLPPLSAREAAEDLEQASRRILEEEKAYRFQRARSPLAGVRDW